MLKYLILPQLRVPICSLYTHSKTDLAVESYELKVAKNIDNRLNVQQFIESKAQKNVSKNLSPSLENLELFSVVEKAADA